MKKQILLVPHNHFDPIWRRCFDRPAVYNGVTVRSAAELEAHCINAWLALTSRGYTFSDGQAAVWRKYLERNPDQKAKLQQHAHAGLLDVVLAGETVADSALSTAEGLVRNFLVAMPFYRDFVGEHHPALKLAWLEDAFGNSPNYPQVLKGVGAEVACWLTYRPCAENVWVGIDGTRLPIADHHPRGFGGAVAKQPPCPACKGAGCASCANTGLLFVEGFDLDALRTAILNALAKHADKEWLAIRFMTEEVLPDTRVADFVDAWNREHTDSEMHFATPLAVYRAHQPVLDAAMRQRDDKPSEDLNPAMPGCMVTRIRCKQRTRALAYHVLAVEARLANASWKAGTSAPPPADLAEAWRLVTFNQFHDAITGTHVDSAHAELMDMLDRAEAIAQRYLPVTRRRPSRGPFRSLTAAGATLRLGEMEVTFDRFGIVSILKDGRDLFGTPRPGWNNRRRRHRIAEMVLEPDFGDAWGTRIPPSFDELLGDGTLVFLGDYHTTVDASDNAIRWRGRYNGGDWKVKRLDWTVTVAASRDGQRLDFHTKLDWDTGSRRLRVLVPVKSEEPTATYEVPFGFVDRTFDKAKLDYTQWKAHQMEFPTLHWVRKTVDEQSGMALFNKGLPCNRWLPGRLDLSLVRSPEWAFGAVEPGSYEFWDTDGQRDSGRHVFEYSLLPYTNGLGAGDLTRMGYDYNLPCPIQVPFSIEGDVTVTAWKLAEDGQGWILRLQESGGQGTVVKLKFDESREVTKTNLIEQSQGKPERGKHYETALHRHGLLTLRVR